MDQIQQNCFNAGAPVAATTSTVPPPPPPAQRKRRRQQIADDDDVEVISLSAEEINAKNLFVCELCNKSFIREQNLLLHGRAHDLPYVRNNRPVKNKDDEKRKVYVCPETTCAHHDRPNALCDVTSLKKHYKRKHCEKTMSCTHCLRSYAVEGDLQAHLKVCGTKNYQCARGSIFSRRDSYMAHRAPCDAAQAQHLSFLGKKFQTSQTTAGELHVPTTLDNSIFNKQPIFSSNTATSAHSLPFLSGTTGAPLVTNLSSSNQSVFRNLTTTDPANNNSIQGSELNNNIFDVDVLHDRLFGVSSVPATALPNETPQGLTLADSGTSASFLGNSENSTPANFDPNVFNGYPNFSSATSGNSYSPVFESLISGTYENPDTSRYHGNNIVGNVFNLQGDYKSGTVNENIFSTSLEDKAMQNGGLSGFGLDQINQKEQLTGHRVGVDANFPVLQDDLNFWENWGN